MLDQFTISKIEDIQLFTVAHHQEHSNGDVDKWSWFDLVILETQESTKPKVKDGRSLVWFSHKATAGNREGNDEQPGRLFDSQDEILKLVEVRIQSRSYPASMLIDTLAPLARECYRRTNMRTVLGLGNSCSQRSACRSHLQQR